MFSFAGQKWKMVEKLGAWRSCLCVRGRRGRKEGEKGTRLSFNEREKL